MSYKRLDSKPLGQLIASLRSERTWSQAQLAEYSKMSQATISQIESGKSLPGLDSLNCIARAFSTTMDSLLCRAYPEETMMSACLELCDAAYEMREADNNDWLAHNPGEAYGTEEVLPVEQAEEIKREAFDRLQKAEYRMRKRLNAWRDGDSWKGSVWKERG